MTRRLKVLGERVLVKRDDPNTVTAGGLYIPAQAQGKTDRGEVLDVGSRVENVQVQDKVMFSKSSGIECELDGEKYLLLREEDVIGILD